VYDPKNNRLVIFGGNNSGGELSDVWVLTNANGLGGTPTWTQLGPFSLFAEARSGHTAVYNTKTNRMTIFGGFTSLGTLDVDTNDVWVLSHANGK
jgi:hypothetical protein